MISNEERLECGWCGETHTLGDWDKVTFEGCRSREMKRAFTTLRKEKAYSKGNASYYKCPGCESWCRGNQLIFKNPVYKKLGGQPILEQVEML